MVVIHGASTPPSTCFVTGNQSLQLPEASTGCSGWHRLAGGTSCGTEAFVGSRARGPCVTFSISGFPRKGQHLLSSHVTLTRWEAAVRDFISLECSTTGGITKPWVSSFHVISCRERKHPPRELESGKYAHSPTLASL